eukprot:m51a1_g14442 hypothetical protein (532) ;mRNA; r:565314-568482
MTGTRNPTGKIRAALNKLAEENLEAVLGELLELDLDSAVRLRDFVEQVAHRAVAEPQRAPLYLSLYQRLVAAIPDRVALVEASEALRSPNSSRFTPRRILLNACQDAFETGIKAARQKAVSEEDHAHFVGVVSFVVVLFRASMLTSRVVHDCIRQMLANIRDPSPTVMEALFVLLVSVGQRLDTPEARKWINAYCKRITTMASNPQCLPKCVRCLLVYILALRVAHWDPVRCKKPLLLALATAAACAAVLNCRTDMALYLKFENATVDETGHFSGRISTTPGAGTPVYDGPVPGKAGFFDGQRALTVAAASSADPHTGNWTLMFWSRFTRSQATAMLMHGRERGTEAWEVLSFIAPEAWSGSSVVFKLCSAAPAVGGCVFVGACASDNDGRWHHHAFRVDRASGRLEAFRDGRRATPCALFAGSERWGPAGVGDISRFAGVDIDGGDRCPLTVGGSMTYSCRSKRCEYDGYWRGELDELAVYRRALSDTEIETASLNAACDACATAEDCPCCSSCAEGYCHAGGCHPSRCT